jgi:hypothetical protein
MTKMEARQRIKVALAKAVNGDVDGAAEDIMFLPDWARIPAAQLILNIAQDAQKATR